MAAKKDGVEACRSKNRRLRAGNEATGLSRDESMMGSGHWTAEEMRLRKEDKLHSVYEAILDYRGNQHASPCVHSLPNQPRKEKFPFSCSPANRAGVWHVDILVTNHLAAIKYYRFPNS